MANSEIKNILIDPNAVNFKPSPYKSLTRREFLRVAVLAAPAPFLAECLPPGPSSASREEVVQRILDQLNCPEGAGPPTFWHQTCLGSLCCVQLCRRAGPEWKEFAAALEKNDGLMSYEELVKRNLAPAQFTRHTIPPQEALIDPERLHSMQLWVGVGPRGLNDCLDKAINMFENRGFYPPVARSELERLIEEENELVALIQQIETSLKNVQTETEDYETLMSRLINLREKLAFTQAKIDLNLTRTLLLEDVAREDQNAVRAVWRPVVLGLAIDESQVQILRDAAIVREGFVPFEEISVIIVGTDLTETELRMLMEQFPRAQIIQDPYLNLRPDQIKTVESAILSLTQYNLALDQELIRNFVQNRPPNITSGLWGRIPEGIYSALCRINNGVLNGLSYATALIIAYEIVRGGYELCKDFFDVLKNYPGRDRTNLTPFEWAINQSRLGQTLLSGQIWRDNTLYKLDPNFRSISASRHWGEIPTVPFSYEDASEPVRQAVDNLPLFSLSLNEEHLAFTLRLRYLGLQEDTGLPILEDESGNQRVIGPNSILAVPIQEDVYAIYKIGYVIDPNQPDRINLYLVGLGACWRYGISSGMAWP